MNLAYERIVIHFFNPYCRTLLQIDVSVKAKLILKDINSNDCLTNFKSVLAQSKELNKFIHTSNGFWCLMSCINI